MAGPEGLGRPREDSDLGPDRELEAMVESARQEAPEAESLPPDQRLSKEAAAEARRLIKSAGGTESTSSATDYVADRHRNLAQNGALDALNMSAPEAHDHMAEVGDLVMEADDILAAMLADGTGAVAMGVYATGGYENARPEACVCAAGAYTAMVEAQQKAPKRSQEDLRNYGRNVMTATAEMLLRQQQ